MASETAGKRGIDLVWVAGATAVAIAVVTLAFLAYLLLNVLLLLFLGIVVAAALQPLHVKLCRWGLPKGAAVLVIYFLFFAGLILIGVLIGPVVVEQITSLLSELPEKYGGLRAYLQNAGGPMHLLGEQLPAFDRLGQTLTKASPEWYWSLIGVTTGALGLLAYALSVLAIGFYWTMEVPRLERLVVSLLPVGRRVHALNTWHEIEHRLGAFVRGQGIVMAMIGVFSGLGYALIGLPNVIALAVVSGLLEALPVVGPITAGCLAVVVALPLGLHSVVLVVTFFALLQAVEDNILTPRIMAHAVGVSALVGILALLAFGTLYGIMGVLIAIPMTAVIQVVLETVIFAPSAAAVESPGTLASPWMGLRTRIRAVRQQTRSRLRSRATRMGIDPGTPDHVVDAVDQQIEEAAEHIDRITAAAEQSSVPLAPEERALMARRLDAAAAQIEKALRRIARVASVVPPGDDQAALTLAELSKASGQVNRAVERIETVFAESVTLDPSNVAAGLPGEASRQGAPSAEAGK